MKERNMTPSEVVIAGAVLIFESATKWVSQKVKEEFSKTQVKTTVLGKTYFSNLDLTGAGFVPHFVTRAKGDFTICYYVYRSNFAHDYRIEVVEPFQWTSALHHGNSAKEARALYKKELAQELQGRYPDIFPPSTESKTSDESSSSSTALNSQIQMIINAFSTYRPKNHSLQHIYNHYSGLQNLFKDLQDVRDNDQFKTVQIAFKKFSAQHSFHKHHKLMDLINRLIAL